MIYYGFQICIFTLHIITFYFRIESASTLESATNKYVWNRKWIKSSTSLNNNNNNDKIILRYNAKRPISILMLVGGA